MPSFSCPPGYRPSRLAGAESPGEICLSARIAMVYIDDAHKTLQRHFGKQTAFLVCLGVLEGSPLPQSREKVYSLAASLICKPQPRQLAPGSINHSLLPVVVAALRYLRSTTRPLNQEFGEQLAKEICVNILEMGRIPAHPRDVERWFFKEKSPLEMYAWAEMQGTNLCDPRFKPAAVRKTPILTPRQRESGMTAGTPRHHHSASSFQS